METYCRTARNTANRLKLYEKSVFPQSFHTRKLGKITVFVAVHFNLFKVQLQLFNALIALIGLTRFTR